jgi:hypothetical protein
MNHTKTVERIVRQEILTCQSSLVDMLLERNLIDTDDIENIWLDCTEWTQGRCLDYIKDMSPDELEGLDTDDDDDVRYTAQNVADDNPNEPLEWWLVTPWLLDKLREAGEPVIDNEYGEWWGRTCSGQSITLDCVIEDIASKVWG